MLLMREGLHGLLHLSACAFDIKNMADSILIRAFISSEIGWGRLPAKILLSRIRRNQQADACVSFWAIDILRIKTALDYLPVLHAYSHQ